MVFRIRTPLYIYMSRSRLVKVGVRLAQNWSSIPPPRERIFSQDDRTIFYEWPLTTGPYSKLHYILDLRTDRNYTSATAGLPSLKAVWLCNELHNDFARDGDIRTSGAICMQRIAIQRAFNVPGYAFLKDSCNFLPPNLLLLLLRLLFTTVSICTHGY